MEALLIINSLLVVVTLYFIREFHRDFKQVAKTVQGLKEKFAEFSTKINHQVKSIKKRLGKVDKKETLK